MTERKRALASTRDSQGNALCERTLAAHKFLTNPNAGQDILAKSVIGGSESAESADRRAQLRERNRIMANFVKRVLKQMDFPLEKYSKRSDKLGDAVRELQRVLEVLEHGPSPK